MLSCNVPSLTDLLSAAIESTRETSARFTAGCGATLWPLTLITISHVAFRACTSALHWLLHFTAAVKYFPRYQNMFTELQSAVCIHHSTKFNRTVICSVDVWVDFGWLLKTVNSSSPFRKWKLASQLSSGIRRRNIFVFCWEFRFWSNPRPVIF